MRGAWGWLLGSLVVVSGCSGPAEAERPLRFDEFESSTSARGATAYFGVPVCVEDEPASVTFTGVEAVQVTGTSDPVTFRVAWPDGPPFDPANAGEGPLPDAYVPVEGASGEVGTCGPARALYGVLAVVLPPVAEQPVTVQDLRVTYEVAEESFTQVVDVSLTRCPDGTRPAADGCRQPRSTR